MSRIAIMAALLGLALLSVAHADDQAGMDPKGVINRARRGVIRVQTADVDSVSPSVGGGGGSGFIFEVNYDDGTAYAITNYHVAGKAGFVSATTWNHTVYNGELVAAEPGIDTALIKLHGIPDERNLADAQKTVVPVTLGDSDKVKAGELAVCMGSPGAFEAPVDRSDPNASFMLDESATSNVVTGRFSPIEWEISMWNGGQNGENFEYATNVDYAFRMSVAINHGNSGGPLLNNRGEAIGIDTWTLVGTGSLPDDNVGQSNNLAVPINLAKDFAYQVINTGKFQKPWLGMDIIFPPSIISPSFGTGIPAVQKYEEFVDQHRQAGKLEVYNVRANSPADKAGLKRGDVILDINGQKFKTPEDVRHWVFSQDIGAPVKLRVLRDGKLLKDPLELSIGAKRTYDSEFSV